ncbi:M23 family metallopeptidase [Geminicoccaceae bacterium 1502E]|nr:M23 family metallopeptidase [Geminicoccaceae bacterium 1502E]
MYRRLPLLTLALLAVQSVAAGPGGAAPRPQPAPVGAAVDADGSGPVAHALKGPAAVAAAPEPAATGRQRVVENGSLPQALDALRGEVARRAASVASLRAARARAEVAARERRVDERQAAGRGAALEALLDELALRADQAQARERDLARRAAQRRLLLGAATAGLARGVGGLAPQGQARLAALAGGAAAGLREARRGQEEFRVLQARTLRQARYLADSRSRLRGRQAGAAEALDEAEAQLETVLAALAGEETALAVAELRASRAASLLALADGALGAGLERRPRPPAPTSGMAPAGLALLARGGVAERMVAALEQHQPARPVAELPDGPPLPGTGPLPAPGILLAGGLDRLPVRGRMVKELGGAGLRARGITFHVGGLEQVEAPRRGQVVFAGTFKSFGLLLILDHGDGYHTLLSGFSSLAVERGQHVAAGQAVGQVAVDGKGGGLLYMELRRGGEPVDPMPYMAAREDKVRG